MLKKISSVSLFGFRISESYLFLLNPTKIFDHHIYVQSSQSKPFNPLNRRQKLNNRKQGERRKHPRNLFDWLENRLKKIKLSHYIIFLKITFTNRKKVVLQKFNSSREKKKIFVKYQAYCESTVCQ